MKSKRKERWIRVNSSALRKIRYNREQQRLDLIYSSGEPYRYLCVPRSKYRALMQAESKGEFVNHEIKPKHPFKKLLREQQR